MRLTIADVLDQLVAEGLASPESIEKARAALQGAGEPSPPWFARVIAGFGAWVATAFLIGFLVITEIVDEPASAMIVGPILVGAAVYLRRTADAEADFTRQLALAGSLAGQVLVIVGIVGETRSAALAGLVALVMSVALIPLVPEQAHRFMSGLIGTIAAFAAMADLHLAWSLGTVAPLGTLVVRGSDLAALAMVGAAAYVWRVGIRERSRELAEMLEPVGYGVVVGTFAVLLFSSIFAVADDFARGSRSTRDNVWHLGPLTTVGVTAALVALELRIFSERRAKRAAAMAVAVGATALLGVMTLSTPGIMAAMTVLTLGLDRRNRILIGLAVVFLVEFASTYYYSLRLTLLEKSIVLVASGLLLLAARAYVELRHSPGEAEA